VKSNQFPKVRGKNLNRKKFQFPDDLPARLTIVLVAFRQHQQMDIDTWLPFAEQMENTYPDVAYVELPVIYKMNPFGQFMLNEGMRAGIPNLKARERTITLYLDKDRFTRGLGIPSEEEIQILLVADGGEILWRETGSFTNEKGATLNQVLLAQSQSIPESISG
jgi:hypothetical protein